MKKRLTALALLLTMVFNSVYTLADEPAEKAEQIIEFYDVNQNDSAYEAVMYLAEKKVIAGKSDNLFYPNDFLKREELAKIFTLAFELPENEEGSVFYDVPHGIWYADFVQRVAAAGYMEGFSEQNFGSGYNMTRQDLAVVLLRAAEKKGINLSAESTKIYADYSEISDYAKTAVETVSSINIMGERANNCWEPRGNVTRAETAIAIYSLLMIHKQQVDALGRFGDESQYFGPFEDPGDRLSQAMPEPFNIDNLPVEIIAHEDFEDEDYGILTKANVVPAATFLEEGGYNSNGCLKIEGNASGTSNQQFTWKTQPGEILPGDYLVLSAMIKGTDISGSGNYRSIIQINDNNGKWLAEEGQPTIKVSRDWTRYQKVLKVPETANALTVPEYYRVNIGAYIANLSGQAYFDDFTLGKVSFYPMNTVLMTPNYKGIIRGEGGIGDISLRAYVDSLNGAWNLDDFKFTAQITDDLHNVLMKSETDNVSDVMDVYFSSAELEMGKDYYLESILTYKESGEQLQKFEWPLHKREADFTTTIGYDEYGRVTKKGVPYIPLSIYNWRDINDLKDVYDFDCIDHFQLSDMVMTHRFGNDKNRQQIAEELEERGKGFNANAALTVYSNLTSGWTKPKITKQSDIRGLLGKIATNFRTTPNLFGYYSYDEQSPLQYGEELAWNRKIIEHYDLDHPTLCAIDKAHTNRRGIYAKTSDFLGYDPYPVTGKDNQDISVVYDRIVEGKQTNPNRPVYAILQGFWFKSRGDLRHPNIEEFRNMAFQALCAGACMIDCYALSEMKTLLSEGRTYEQNLSDLKTVYSEIKYLEPIILSELPSPYYEIKGNEDWLNTMSKRYNGKSYLFMVNNQSTSNIAYVYLDGVKKIKGMYSKKEYFADDEGIFKIACDGYGVEVFEYEQADYKSSHAELIRFGLSDVITADSESEVSTFIIPAEFTEASYNATISDYAQLYINGKKVEKTGKLSLDGLDKINVKVVSEDGRFETEKLFMIERN